MLKLTRKVLSLALIACIVLSVAIIVPPVTKVSAATKIPENGWYNLRAMNNYLNIDASGGAELRNNSASGNQAYFVENKGNGQITLKMTDGRYLGINDAIEDGVRVKAVNSPYVWNVYSENNDDIYSLRPSTDAKKVLNASGQKNEDGTPIILWTHEDLNAPNHAEFRFISANATPSQTGFVINNQPASVSAAYSINGTNYLQLRAIAAMLNGTKAQFDVSWDGQYAVIEPGKPYSGAVPDTKLQTTLNVSKSDTKFKMNNEIFSFEDARLIDGGTNYIQLREFAQKLSGTVSQFNVYWDGTAGKAVIQPGTKYTGYAPGAEPKVASANKVDMVLIPSGTYTTGGRKITISQSFYMGIYPVTQEQYKAVMGTNPSLFQGSGKIAITNENNQTFIYNRTAAAGEDPNKRPVDRVNWYNAIVFCNKLSINEGLTPAYSIGGITDPDKWGKMPTKESGSSEVWDSVEIVQGSTGYRLPTEGQWEYAARAGTTTKNYTGDKMTDETGWYSLNSDSQTHEAGKKQPNAFGLYDMIGNVWEWCWDWYNSELPLYSQTDPTGPKGPLSTNARSRVMRGGAFSTAPEYSTSDTHWHAFHEYTEPDIGFRVVRPDPASMPNTEKPVIQDMQWISSGTLGDKKVEGFYIGTYEVTQKQYAEVMNTWPSEFKNGNHITKGEDYNNRPVEKVSWYDAIKFCNILSMKEGLSPAYRINGSTNPSKWGVVPTKKDEKWDAAAIVTDSNGYRLPTELQWEYACKAGTTTKYNNGKDELSADKNKQGVTAIKSDNTAWYAETSPYRDGVQKTHEVGLLAANAFGLYDMHGNVWEWCWSEPTSKGNRMIRGGSFASGASNITSSFRSSSDPSTRKNSIGFRIVLPYSDTLPNKNAEPLETTKNPVKMLQDGWYVLNIVNRPVAFNAKGELIINTKDQSQVFYIENLGNNQITIKTRDGKYVGISDDIKAGTVVKKVIKPYQWYITFESGGIRPAAETNYVAIVTEGFSYDSNIARSTWADGSRIALTKSALPDKNKDDVSNAQFQFYPTRAPK